MRSVTILGATGSVGTSTLDLIERAPDRFRVKALTANCDVEGLAAAARRTNAELAVVADESCLPALEAALAGTGIAAAGGADAVCAAAAAGADWTMAAIVGCAGLKPVMAALGPAGRPLPVVVAMAGVFAFGWHLIWQLGQLDIDSPDSCLRLFRANRDAGLIPALFLAVSLFL